jgi:hypothetical protein
MSDTDRHIPVAILWKYSRESAIIIRAHFEHLERCKECVVVTSICRYSPSLQEVINRLAKLGISRD